MKQLTRNSFATRHGLYVGLILILISLTLYSTSGVLMAQKGIASWGPTILFITGLYFFTRMFRSQQAAHFDYWASFKTSFLIGFYASVIFSFYLYIMYRYTSDSLRHILLQIQETYQESGLLQESDLENLMKLMERIYTPGLAALSSLIGMVIQTTIISLILAVFLKQKSTLETIGFDKDMNQIE